MRAPLTALLANLLFAGALCLSPSCVKEAAKGPQSGGPLAAHASSDSAVPGYPATAHEQPTSFSDPPSRGPANAPIVIETYGDFECPYCAHAAVLLRKLEQIYPNDVRVVWRNFPLEFHARAVPAANAALAAYEQGGNSAFWQMHDLLFATHFAESSPGLTDEEIQAFAEKSGVAPTFVERAMNENRYTARISQDLERGRLMGISATPSFVLNGFVIEGLVPLKGFRHAIDALLRQRQERLKHAI
ncbi:MAG: thioredoxin domain-containing protein [Polyangiaceae bacterium]|nr:thioredoxin domain-containing protein [Polyangiaceae bacterium]